MDYDAVLAFWQKLRSDDEVTLEATRNTSAIVRLLTPLVVKVMVANLIQVRAIAHACVKSWVQAVFPANLVPNYSGHMFGKGARDWLSAAPLPKAERDLLARHLDELDWLKGKLEMLDGSMARIVLDDTRTRKLMTIAGMDSSVATAVIAAIGDISRFPRRLTGLGANSA